MIYSAITIMLALAAPALNLGADAKAKGDFQSQSVFSCAKAPLKAVHSFHVVTNSETDGYVDNGPISLKRALMFARAGDTLYLATGNYGDVALTAENTDFITVTAEPGQKPIFRSLIVGGNQRAQHWRVTTLTIEGSTIGQLQKNGWQQHPFLVSVVNATDVILDHNTLRTRGGIFPWEPEIRGRISSPQLMGGISSNNSTCTAIVENNITNVWDGISAGGDQVNKRGTRIDIEQNYISDFAGDGIDHFGSEVNISKNIILNGHDLCEDQCVHNDGIQGWNYNNQANIVNRDIVISQNTIIGRSGPPLKLPAGDLHGITIFDGSWDNVSVENNVVVSSTWHGISLYGVDHGKIINNTVVSPDSSRPAWIMIKAKKTDNRPATYDTVVRNNISSSVVVGQPNQAVLGVVNDHNFITSGKGVFSDQNKELFVEFNPPLGRYDLHLSVNSPAIAKGTDIGAPQVDLEGRTRTNPTDAGAFSVPAL